MLKQENIIFKPGILTISYHIKFFFMSRKLSPLSFIFKPYDTFFQYETRPSHVSVVGFAKIAIFHSGFSRKRNISPTFAPRIASLPLKTKLWSCHETNQIESKMYERV